MLRDAEQAARSRRLFHSSPVGVKTSEYHYGEAENSKKYGLAYGNRLTYADARRNIVTRGVDLNHPVGRRFLVGGVEYLGQHLCEPCAHLERLTKPVTLKGLIRHGSLRANVLTASFNSDHRMRNGQRRRPVEVWLVTSGSATGTPPLQDT